jgi:predicted dehydrogenase
MHALLDAQRKYGVIAATGHVDHSREPLARTIKSIIDSGELGKIAAIEKTTAHSGGLHIQPGDWRGDPEKNPGGMLFQCGVHALHELMFYFGPVAEISALMRYDLHTTGTADVAVCQLKFASGLVGTLNAYHVTPYRHTFNVFGTDASLYRDERYGPEGVLLTRQQRRTDNGYEPRETVVVEDQKLSYGDVLSFFGAIRHGEALYPSLQDGARAVAAVFAAEESAITNRPVTIAPID